jgi:hypothetical protein
MHNKQAVIRNWRFGCSALALFLAAANSFNATATEAKPHADLSRLVIIGDSLLAGYQNGSLMASQQTNGIAAIIARQAKTDLALPLIAEPGFPNVLKLVSAGPPPVIQPSSGTSTGRVDMLTQTMNLAVPGHRVIDTLEKRPDFPIDSMTDLVLGLPGLLSGVSRSQVEWAEALHPTTVIAWIGNNDALNAAIDGNIAGLTPVPEFEVAYSNLVKRLTATGATVVVANIPDVSVIPFIVPVPTIAALLNVPLPMLVAGLGVSTNDYITLDNIPTVVSVLQDATAGPLTPDEILDAEEIEQIRDTTRQYNQIIAAQAAANNAVLVDANAFLNRLDRHGVRIGGDRLSTDFLGGIFSLDGIHSSNTGAALTANYFIMTMNRHAAAHIPPVNVRKIERDDPLVFEIPHDGELHRKHR